MVLLFHPSPRFNPGLPWSCSSCSLIYSCYPSEPVPANVHLPFEFDIVDLRTAYKGGTPRGRHHHDALWRSGVEHSPYPAVRSILFLRKSAWCWTDQPSKVVSTTSPVSPYPPGVSPCTSLPKREHGRARGRLQRMQMESSSFGDLVESLTITKAAALGSDCDKRRGHNF